MSRGNIKISQVNIFEKRGWGRKIHNFWNTEDIQHGFYSLILPLNEHHQSHTASGPHQDVRSLPSSHPSPDFLGMFDNSKASHSDSRTSVTACCNSAMFYSFLFNFRLSSPQCKCPKFLSLQALKTTHSADSPYLPCYCVSSISLFHY